VADTFQPQVRRLDSCTGEIRTLARAGGGSGAGFPLRSPEKPPSHPLRPMLPAFLRPEGALADEGGSVSRPGPGAVSGGHSSPNTANPGVLAVSPRDGAQTGGALERGPQGCSVRDRGVGARKATPTSASRRSVPSRYVARRPHPFRFPAGGRFPPKPLGESASGPEPNPLPGRGGSCNMLSTLWPSDSEGNHNRTTGSEFRDRTAPGDAFDLVR